MAVERVFGRVDGAEVVLEWKGDVWSVPVPFDRDGEYVVEIIAEDDAGNQAYMAKMLFVVNAALLCVHVIRQPYLAVLQEENHHIQLLSSGYSAGLQDDSYSACVLPGMYHAELIEPACNLADGRM